MTPAAALAELVRIGVRALDGEAPDGSGLARTLVDVGLSLVPVDELRAHLDAAAAARAEAAADLAEDAKFGPRP